MASNTTDPVVVEADRRVEQAKASLRARIGVLERRLGDVRDRIDLPEQVRQHPLPAVGIAFALGALVGGRGRAAGRATPPIALTFTSKPRTLGGKPRTLGGMARAIVTGLAFELVREYAIGRLRRTAERWWSEHGGEFDEPT